MRYPTYDDASGRRFGLEEEEAAIRVLRSGHLWRVDGVEAPVLEREFAAMFGVGHGVAAATGSGVIHAAIAALDLEPGDEVIVPPITDIGSSIGVIAQGLVPVFADLDPITGNLTAATVEAACSERTKAVVVVHLFGGGADVEGIVAAVRPRGIKVVEDCAQAYLTRTPAGALAGTVGDVGCFSLQQSKHISTGDGGVLVTDDAELARRAALFTDKGWPRDSGERTHLFHGLNYRMSELTAAVARVQLTRVEGVVADRRRVAAAWDAALDVPGVTLPPSEGHAYWLYPLVLDPAQLDRDVFVARLREAGLAASAGYLQRVLYENPVLAEHRTFGTSGWPLTLSDRPAPSCPVAERLVRETLVTIGINENFTDEHVDASTVALAEAVAAARRRHG